jgi:hypothetical protein
MCLSQFKIRAPLMLNCWRGTLRQSHAGKIPWYSSAWEGLVYVGLAPSARCQDLRPSPLTHSGKVRCHLIEWVQVCLLRNTWYPVGNRSNRRATPHLH